MSGLSSRPDDFSSDSPELVFRRISRALDYADGFWLGFAKCNLHPQRRAAVAACKELLEPLNVQVVELQLDGPTENLLAQIKDCLATKKAEYSQRIQHGRYSSDDTLGPTDESEVKWAVFVYGIEHSIRTSVFDSPLLAFLNLNREQFRSDFPHPLLIWLPEYALVAISRSSPDFWAWRSGFYELRSEISAKEMLDPIHRLPTYSSPRLSAIGRRENLSMLKGLMSDYAELDRGFHELRVEHKILIKIGLLHQDLCEYVEADRAFNESLSIAVEMRKPRLIVEAKHRLGRLAQIKGDYTQAFKYFDENLRTARDHTDSSPVAFALFQLGRLEQEFGDLQRGATFLEEALGIRRELQQLFGMSLCLIQLGKILQKQRRYAEAQRLFRESLKICRDEDISAGVSNTFCQLGLLKKEMGDLYDAEKLLVSSLRIKRDDGDHFGEAVVLAFLGTIKHELGYYREARKLLGKSLAIKREIGDARGEAYVLRRMGDVYRDEGSSSRAREYYKDHAAIIAKIGIGL